MTGEGLEDECVAVGQEMGPSVQVDESKPSVLDDLRAKSEQVASSACRNGRYEEKSL